MSSSSKEKWGCDCNTEKNRENVCGSQELSGVSQESRDTRSMFGCKV